MAGLALARALELWNGTTWSNITPYVDSDISIQVGRQSAGDGLTAASMSFALRGHDGRFVPGNPVVTDPKTGVVSANPIYPYFKRGARLRLAYTGTDGVSRYGAPVCLIDEIRPIWDGATVASARVEVVASDPIAIMLRTTMLCDWLEQVSLRTTVYGSPYSDAWEPAAGPSETPFMLSRGQDGAGYEGVVAHADGWIAGAVGSASSGSADGSALGSSIALEPVESATATVKWTGRAVAVKWDFAPQLIQFWIRIPADAQVEDSTSGFALSVATLYDGGLNPLGYIRWYWYPSGSGSWVFIPEVETGVTGTWTIATNDKTGLLQDGSWRLVTLQFDPLGESNWQAFTEPGRTETALFWASTGLSDPLMLDQARCLLVGGDLPAGLGGNVRRATRLEVGPIRVDPDSEPGRTPARRGLQESSVNSKDRILDFQYYALGRGITESIGGAWFESGGTSTARQAILSTGGTKLGESFDTALRTAGATCIISPGSRFPEIYGNGTNPSSVGSGANSSAITITLGDDCTPGLELSASFEDRPSRVTVTYPRGETTFANAALEADGVAGDASLASAAWDSSDASVAAADLLRRFAPDLWIRSITVDLVTATHNLWALPSSLRVGQRLTLAGLPSAWFGSTTVDYEVLGWTFTFGHTQAFVRIEMRPAGFVPVVESTSPSTDLAPRIAEDDATLVSAITSSGTTVVLASSSPFSTAAGDYPMRVTIDREVLSLPSAPGSSTSPQTWTSVTRGVSPTLATAHSAGATATITEGTIVGS